MEGSQDRPAPVDEGEELAAGELVERGDGLEVGVDPVEQVSRPAGAGRPAGARPATPPGAAGPPGRGFSRCHRVGLGPDLAGEVEVDGHVPADDDDDLARRRARRRVAVPASSTASLDASRSGGTHRSCSSSVERLGEGLGDRAGAVDRAGGHAADLGGDRAGLEQPQLAVGADGPLDVLGAAEHRRRPARRASTSRSKVGPGARARRSARTRRALASGSSDVARPVDLAADERLGPAVHGGDDARRSLRPVPGRCRTARRRSAGRSGAGRARRSGGRAPRPGPGSRAPHRPRRRSSSRPVDPDDRLELAGHRGRRRCPRPPTSERATRAGRRRRPGRRPRRTAGWATVGAGVDLVGERRGQHHPVQGRQPGRRRSGERRGLAAGEGDVVADESPKSSTAGTVVVVISPSLIETLGTPSGAVRFHPVSLAIARVPSACVPTFRDNGRAERGCSTQYHESNSLHPKL